MPPTSNIPLPSAPQRTALLLLVLAACGSDGINDTNDDMGGADGGASTGADGGGSSPDAMPGSSPDAGVDSQLDSTLTSDCAGLQGRAVVNFNGNLGISFTEAESPFTFLGSIQFELPGGFTGSAPNPENWDGDSERQIVALTSSSYSLHGNHCWFDNPPGDPGSVIISDYRPSEGIVKAQFNALALRSCTGASVCTISGAIETTGQGVYE